MFRLFQSYIRGLGVRVSFFVFYVCIRLVNGGTSFNHFLEQALLTINNKHPSEPFAKRDRYHVCEVYIIYYTYHSSLVSGLPLVVALGSQITMVCFILEGSAMNEGGYTNCLLLPIYTRTRYVGIPGN